MEEGCVDVAAGVVVGVAWGYHAYAAVVVGGEVVTEEGEVDVEGGDPWVGCAVGWGEVSADHDVFKVWQPPGVFFRAEVEFHDVFHVVQHGCGFCAVVVYAVFSFQCERTVSAGDGQ